MAVTCSDQVAAEKQKEIKNNAMEKKLQCGAQWYPCLSLLTFPISSLEKRDWSESEGSSFPAILVPFPSLFILDVAACPKIGVQWAEAGFPRG